MGYDVHVTRAEHWSESDATPIAREEWLAVVASDPELRLDDAAEAPLGDGSVLRHEAAGLAVWTAYSGHGRGGNMAWLDYRDGEIVAKNPDAEILGKLSEIAARLGARVQGDDGELYPSGEAAAQSEAPRPGIGSRVFRRVRYLFRRAQPLEPVEVVVQVGRRYRYLGRTCTVMAIDPKAEHGLGALTVQFDDGGKLTFALVGDAQSTLEPLPADPLSPGDQAVRPAETAHRAPPRRRL